MKSEIDLKEEEEEEACGNCLRLFSEKLWLEFFEAFVPYRLTLNVLLYYVYDLHTARRYVVCGFLQYVASSNALFILPLHLEFKCVSKRININPLTPELNPPAQRCMIRFVTGDFASLNVYFVNICAENQQIH